MGERMKIETRRANESFESEGPESDKIEIERSKLLLLREQYSNVQMALQDSTKEEERLKLLVARMQAMSKSQAHLLREALAAKLHARDEDNAEALQVMRAYEQSLEKANVDPVQVSKGNKLFSDIFQRLCERHREEGTRIIAPTNRIESPVSEELNELRSENNRLRALVAQGGNSLPPATSNKDDNSNANEEELLLLRAQIEDLKGALAALSLDSKTQSQQVQPVQPPSQQDSSVSSAEVAKLKQQIEDLAQQVEDGKALLAKEQERANKAIAKAKAAAAAAAENNSPAAPQAPVEDPRVPELEEEIANLQKELESSKTQLKSAQKKSAELEQMYQGESGAKEAQLAQLIKEKETLQNEVKEWEVKANEMVEETKKEAKKKLKEELKTVKKQGEAEKEELMQAMSQEIEQLETTHKSESKKLKKELKALKSHTKNSTQKISDFKDVVLSRKAEIQKLRQTVLADLRSMPEIASNTARTIIGRLGGIQNEIQELKVKYNEEATQRKVLFNLVQELRGNIRVFCRCRPPSKKEIGIGGGDSEICAFFPAVGEVKLCAGRGREKVFEFDQVFDFNSTQESVYKEVSPLIISSLDGYNVCIFAYGQTGTGKTFTMTGPPDNRGVNTRALNDLFLKCQSRRADFEDQITVSILEVYNELIRDLLAEDVGSKKLEIRQGPQGNYVPDLTIVPVESLDEVLELMRLADQNRSSSCTNMNEHSSRSHLMLTVYVNSLNKISQTRTNAKLNLIDLAGSERIDKSGAVGQALKEAQNINKSLSALGDVIAARANKNGHVPFRNSTLTYLLQDCLSGDSKTLMFVCISPVSFNSDESYCSLNFAQRARSVELGRAQKNVDGGAPPRAQSAKRER